MTPCRTPYWIHSLVGIGLALAAGEARAQDPDPAVPESPAQPAQPATAPPVALAPSAPAPSTPQTVAPSVASAAPAVGSVGCVLVNTGLDPASAETGLQLVCDEIRSRGVALAPSGVATAEVFRISFERLGNALIVRASYEAPAGKVIRTRRMMLSGPEQLTFAAARLAQSIVYDEPLEASQKMDNLVAEETRKSDKKPGEFLWGLGIVGGSAPGQGVWMSPGFELMGYYETPRYGFGFSLRSVLATGDKELSYASAGVGGRYFFSEQDFSPFVGGGLAVSGIELSDRNDYDERADGGGLGAFAEVGVEFMRLHSSRMIVGLRVDTPFYQLEHESWDSNGMESSVDKRWALPVMISATYAW